MQTFINVIQYALERGIFMSRQEVISKIIEVMQKEEIVEACYTKESQSDKIIMYAVINQKELNQYLEKRSQYLESYDYILFQKDFGDNKMICIFDDGVCIELNHIFLDQVKSLKNCVTLFDRYDQFLLSTKEELNKNQLLAEKVDLFSYKIYEIVRAYKTKNVILFNLKKIEALGLLADYYVIKKDDNALLSENSYINLDKESKLEIDKLVKTSEIIKELNYFLIKFEKELMQLPISIFSLINMDFFKHVKKDLIDLL